jgi:GNAT superfamily N-acetyltransferase
MKEASNQKLVKAFWFYGKLINASQSIFCIRRTHNFVVHSVDDLKRFDHQLKFRFIPITYDNYHRVGEFRASYRILDYGERLARKEIGYFAEEDGKIIGSIWAILNKAEKPRVLRTFMVLMPNEALVYDAITAVKYRRQGIGLFMAIGIVSELSKKYGVSSITADVLPGNRSSLGMLDKLGVHVDHSVTAVVVFGRVIFRRIYKRSS